MCPLSSIISVARFICQSTPSTAACDGSGFLVPFGFPPFFLQISAGDSGSMTMLRGMLAVLLRFLFLSSFPFQMYARGSICETKLCCRICRKRGPIWLLSFQLPVCVMTSSLSRDCDPAFALLSLYNTLQLMCLNVKEIYICIIIH